MSALYLKEIRSFLHSIIGYIAMVVFLLLLGTFMWIIPNGSNVFDNGFATIDPLFVLAPWVFLFLTPAITMRSFAEEARNGTMEFLLTKPLNDIQIVLAKYFAGVTLVLLSLLPTLVYYYTVSELGNPKGNIDSGGMWGSYIGLFFLASAFIAIGIFASALVKDQVSAFILAVALCFLCYTGFGFISSISLFGKFDAFILNLGINEHFISMSRGVIDSRDVVYFVSLSLLFILGTRTVIESRKW